MNIKVCVYCAVIKWWQSPDVMFIVGVGKLRSQLG